MKKISFSKNDSKVRSGLPRKLRVAALALGVTAMTAFGACSEDDDEPCTDSDIGTTADPVGEGDEC